MDKRAQVLMMGLWILAILTILAVGLGHRVSMGLRMSRYQRESLKASYLAKAGLNLMIAEIEKDTNDTDALNESWANNESVFKKITLNENADEYATVSFSVPDESGGLTVIYGARDLESRININTASREALLALMEKLEIQPAQDIANNILIWRQDMPDEGKIYEKLGYPCKAGAFSKTEELNLVKDFGPEDFERIKDAITVFTENLVNINTASLDVLSILSRSIAKKLGIEESYAESVAVKIADLRKLKGYFKDKDEIAPVLTGSEETGIFNVLMNNVTLKSDYFLIEVTGNSSKIKRKIEAVYSRKDKKILDWHES
jgi:type II secretory pathway component PulK